MLEYFLMAILLVRRIHEQLSLSFSLSLLLACLPGLLKSAFQSMLRSFHKKKKKTLKLSNIVSSGAISLCAIIFTRVRICVFGGMELVWFNDTHECPPQLTTQL